MVVEAGFFVALKCSVIVLKLHFAASKDIIGVTVAFTFLIGFVCRLNGLLNISLVKVGPGYMLVGFVIVLLVAERGLVATLSLAKLVLLLVEYSDFEQRVDLTLDREDVGQDRVLEVGDGLLDLVCFSVDHSELVEHF